MEDIEIIKKYDDLFVMKKITSQAFNQRVEVFYQSLNQSLTGAEEWHTNWGAKKFREELYPMKIFLQNNVDFSDIKMSEKNKSYDALIYNGSMELRVEITTGDGDKEIEFWQSKYRDRDLSVATPITGVTKCDFKAAVQKNQTYFGHAVRRSDAIKIMVLDVVASVRKKQERECYDDCILLVSVNKDFTQSHLDEVHNIIVGKSLIHKKQFSGIYLIGLQKKLSFKLC